MLESIGHIKITGSYPSSNRAAQDDLKAIQDFASGAPACTDIAIEIYRNPACENIVVDIGSASRAMLAALYRRSTALVFPSLYEGFGIPLVEAMHYGLPIIASNQSCMPEVCGNSAILLSPALPSLWAYEMLRLMTNKDIK